MKAFGAPYFILKHPCRLVLEKTLLRDKVVNNYLNFLKVLQKSMELNCCVSTLKKCIFPFLSLFESRRNFVL